MVVEVLAQYYHRFKPSKKKRASSVSKLSLASPHVPILEPMIARGRMQGIECGPDPRHKPPLEVGNELCFVRLTQR